MACGRGRAFNFLRNAVMFHFGEFAGRSVFSTPTSLNWHWQFNYVEQGKNAARSFISAERTASVPLISAALMRRWAEWIEARVPIVASSVSRLFENDPRALQAFFFPFLWFMNMWWKADIWSWQDRRSPPGRTVAGWAAFRKRGLCFSNVFLPF